MRLSRTLSLVFLIVFILSNISAQGWKDKILQLSHHQQQQQNSPQRHVSSQPSRDNVDNKFAALKQRFQEHAQQAHSSNNSGNRQNRAQVALHHPQKQQVHPTGHQKRMGKFQKRVNRIHDSPRSSSRPTGRRTKVSHSHSARNYKGPGKTQHFVRHSHSKRSSKRFTKRSKNRCGSGKGKDRACYSKDKYYGKGKTTKGKKCGKGKKRRLGYRRG